MDKNKVDSEIEYDLEKGIYDNFGILKTKLGHIASKLRESSIVINSSKELTHGETRTLADNGYIEKTYDQGERHLHDILHISKQSLMTIENTKIWIGGDVEKSKKVQEILFKLGCEWMGGSTEIFERNMNYVRVDSKKNAIFSPKCSREFFLKLEEIEISYDDLCQMYPTNTEPELTYSGLFPPRSKAEEEATTTMGVYEKGLIPQHLMCGCDVGEGKDSSINIFFDKLKGTKWEDCKNEDNFIQPSHLKRIEHSTKQIPSWGGKLYVIPPKGKIRPRIKAKRAWEIL